MSRLYVKKNPETNVSELIFGRKASIYIFLAEMRDTEAKNKVFVCISEIWEMTTDCNEREDCNGVDLDFSDSVDANDLKIFCNYWLFAKER